MLKKEYNISILIAKFLTGDMNEDERRELEAWKEDSVENQQLFERLCAPAHITKLNTMAGRYDKTEAWRKLEKKLTRSRITGLRKWVAYAAVLLLPLAVCYFLIKTSEEILSPNENVAEVVTPGSSKATLTLADGSIVDLEDVKEFELKEKDGTRINKDSSALNYNTNNSSNKIVYNKIEIPKGGEYTLKLSDGSMVYLNAMSSLRFPVNFIGDKREVELQGEAYFEVAKDHKPFIVKTTGMNIEVLGTVFNISAYAEDQVARTTLVNGSVKVTSDCLSEAIILKPSQQASFYKSANQITVKEVDIAQYTAWKNGRFYFKDWRLEDIITYLSRWYDVDVFYQNDNIKDIRFGCNINRYGEIAPILELLEQTDKITAKLKGRTIVFTNK